MLESTRQRIIVIGGGITGLAAAHRVRELNPDVEVTLLEASARLGGVIETVERDGFLLERGPDNFISNVKPGIDLCQRIGLAEDLLETNAAYRRAFVVRRGKLLPIPEGFMLMAPRNLWAVLGSPVLSPWGKLRVICEFFVQPNKSTEEETLAEFAIRRLGREAYERLVQPLVAGIYTADGDELSVNAALPQFVEMEREHGGLIRGAYVEVKRSKAAAKRGDSGARYSLFLAPRLGMSQLVEALAENLPVGAVRLKSPVRSLVKRGGGAWSVQLEGSGPRLDAAGVVLALPTHAAARLLKDVDPKVSTALSQIPYAGSVVVNLGFRRGQVAHRLDGFGFVVPAIERRQILAGSFSSVKYAGRAPDGYMLIRVFLGGAMQPKLVEADDRDLRHIVLKELDDLLGLTGEPLFCDIARWRQSMPQYTLGHVKRVQELERQVALHTGLALAGNAFRGVGVPQCIHSGERAAERALTAV